MWWCNCRTYWLGRSRKRWVFGIPDLMQLLSALWSNWARNEDPDSPDPELWRQQAVSVCKHQNQRPPAAPHNNSLGWNKTINKSWFVTKDNLLLSLGLGVQATGFSQLWCHKNDLPTLMVDFLEFKGINLTMLVKLSKWVIFFQWEEREVNFLICWRRLIPLYLVQT